MICTVCFSGTSHRLASQLIDHKLPLYSQTLAGFIYENSCKNNEDFVIGFDGCGITHPLSGLGGLFASGLQDHARCVEEKIRDQLKKNPQEKITLNVYGHSRGAIAALYLSQYLKDLSSEKLEINLALLDPVPGTYLWVANLGTGLSVAEKSIDLSTCGNLSHVLCLYPNVPLPDILCHAPLFPIWPKKCRVEEMVIPGCHSEAEIHYYFMEKNKKKFTFSCASFIASIKVCRFLHEHGTQLSNMPDESDVIIFNANNTALITSFDDRSISGERDSVWNSYFSFGEKPLIRKTHSVGSVTTVESRDQRASIEKPLLKKPNISDVKNNCDNQHQELLGLFLEDIEKAMSSKSKNSEKGEILNEIKLKLNNINNSHSLTELLIELTALALQRDRTFILFFQTTSGQAMVRLLNDKKYHLLRAYILPNQNSSISYQDLIDFCLSGNSSCLKSPGYLYSQLKT